jgi:hypothetical protein
MCSTLEVKIRVPLSLLRLATPLMAKLLLSVAPEVKIIDSFFSALINPATFALASSTAHFASWPKT